MKSEIEFLLERGFIDLGRGAEVVRNLQRERDELRQMLAADSAQVDAYLGVCTERDELRAEVERMKAEAERSNAVYYATNEKLILAEIEIASLQADKARMNWLIEKGSPYFLATLSDYPDDAIQAIDEAMKGDK